MRKSRPSVLTHGPADPFDERRDPRRHWPANGGALRCDDVGRRPSSMEAELGSNELRVLLGKIAFLEALLRSENGVATIDDATSPTDLRRAFADGGQWRGAITRSLAAKRIIKSIAAGPSKRPSRHSGIRHVWQLVDRAKALKLHRHLVAQRRDSV
jgi:hypothetical protein